MAKHRQCNTLFFLVPLILHLLLVRVRKRFIPIRKTLDQFLDQLHLIYYQYPVWYQSTLVS